MTESSNKEDLGRFLAIAAHELRTPITSLKVALQLIRKRVEGGVDPGLDLVDVAERNTQRIQSLVDDLIEFMKLSTGETVLKREPVQIPSLLAEAQSGGEEKTSRTDIKIVGESRELPAISCDADRLGWVLAHLIQNSAHASEAGSGIELSASQDEENVVLRVSDHGKGVEEPNLGRIFDPFYQVDSSDTREIPGLGLGLAICKGIVELHQGRIWAEAQTGEGCVIQISLPLADPAS